MKKHPILFSDEMVRAILDGRKTQTRRVVKQQDVLDSRNELVSWDGVGEVGDWEISRCPYGAVGDQLWVREAFAYVPITAYRCSTGIIQTVDPTDAYQAAIYRENFDRAGAPQWKPSIHMPRWASRITLEITDIRVERLQEISEADAIAEGCPAVSLFDLDCESTPPLHHFRNLWDSINAERAPWASNPWIWIIEFKKV